MSFIDPVVDANSRTVEVRVEVENRQGLLKPGMLVEGTVDVLLDADGEPVIDTAGAVPPRVIPASAPLLTVTAPLEMEPVTSSLPPLTVVVPV